VTEAACLTAAPSLIEPAPPADDAALPAGTGAASQPPIPP